MTGRPIGLNWAAVIEARRAAIRESLHESKPLRAKDFAAHFECGIRTIYRDLKAIGATGYAGHGGGYVRRR